ELHLAGVPLLERLADTGDHAQPGLESSEGPARDRLVRLAEVLPPLRVADDRALHTQLEQDLGGDLPGECALGRPVDVLGKDRVAAGDRRAERPERRAQHRLDALGRRECLAKLARLARAFEHLLVAGDQLHASGITATPGSSLPSSSPSAAPPPVEAHETRSSRPSSLRAFFFNDTATTENAS